MVNFTAVAIFILATAQHESLERRVIPIVEEWGQYFPHKYFVFGRNVPDKAFLDSKCDMLDKVVDRNLLARSPQTPSENNIYRFSCTTPSQKGQFYGLFAANCTGEYYGIGPTCRCQEAIRYFISQKERFEGVEWFIFMDDDLFLRPFAFTAMLSEFDSRKPMAIVSSDQKGEFRGMKNFSECYKQFRMAMPGILTRAAVDQIAPAIHADGMTRAQAEWRGTHDVLLGYILWLYNVSTYSLIQSGLYSGGKLHLNIVKGVPSKLTKVLRPLKNHVLFHNIKGGNLVSSSEMAILFPFPLPPHKKDYCIVQGSSDASSNNCADPLSSSELKNLEIEQILGRKAFRLLMAQDERQDRNYSLALLAFHRKHNNFPKVFTLFQKKHCLPSYFTN